MLIKYYDWLNKNPNFFDDFDPLIKPFVDDWFMFRYLGSSEQKFNKFLKRTIKQYEQQFKEQIKLDNLRHQNNLDYFVYDYSENWNSINKQFNQNSNLNKNSSINSTNTINKSGTNSNTSNSDITNNSTSTSTNNATSLTNTTNNSTSTSKNTASSNSENTTTSTTDSKGLSSLLPNSITNSGGDFETSFVWNTASSKEQSKNSTQSSTNSSDTSNADNTITSYYITNSDTTNKSDNTITSDSTNKNKVTGSGTYSEQISYLNGGNNIDSSSGNVSSKDNITNLSINSGRTSKSPSEVLTEAYNFIRKYNTYEWLYDALNICFYGLFVDDDDIEEV